MINTANEVSANPSSPAALPLTEIENLFDASGNFMPNCYINRDLSALRFQLRVLAQAANVHHPLLERMFF